MLSGVFSAGVFGIDGYTVEVETFLSSGLPAFDIVGLPGTSVRESRDRVRAALRNSGFEFPMKRITVNLAPADIRKEGPIYDLPILLGLLSASNQLSFSANSTAFIGELSLKGNLRPTTGILSMALALKTAGFTSVFVPYENAAETALVDGLTVYAARHVAEIIDHLEGKKYIQPHTFSPPVPRVSDMPDFNEVKGQEAVKRALEIASAGSHNLLMRGSPGSGKSMLAQRLVSILPPMTLDEALESTKIHSVAGLLSPDEPLLGHRPFRAPHHTVTASGLAGGGSSPKPGEISVVHNGVLFLDELPEFDRRALEVLRQPIEDGQITLSRVSGTYTYPCRFMLVCAMNPCRCGWHGHPSGRCVCTPSQISAYLGKISGPLLDRIDIFIDVNPLTFETLSDKTPTESSSSIKARVETARESAVSRYAKYGIGSNGRLPSRLLREFCVPDKEGAALLKSAFDRLQLTARAYDRILRVARTIADLEGSDTIKVTHIAESLQYRPSL